MKLKHSWYTGELEFHQGKLCDILTLRIGYFSCYCYKIADRRYTRKEEFFLFLFLFSLGFSSREQSIITGRREASTEGGWSQCKILVLS